MTESGPEKVAYAELMRLFIRMSLSAFGGPVAHIAIAEEEVVNRRQWLTREHFLDLIAATNLIPGPNSTEVMIHVGYTLRGIPGALVTGVCFIAPAFLLTLLLSIMYVSGGTLPQVKALFWGIKPVIIAVIATAGYRLLNSALKSRELWILFVLGTAIIAGLRLPEVVVMLGGGLLYALYQTWRPQSAASLLLMLWQPLAQPVTDAAPTLLEIFAYFLRIGAVLFGSGYLLVAYIQQDVVNTFGWLTTQQLIDAIAIGQTTPGPVLTTTAAVGYIVAGIPGALVAGSGIFLPSFVFVILSAPLIPRMRQSKLMSAFLSGVNAIVVAAILVTLVDLTREALLTPDGTQFSIIALVLAVAALVAMMRFKINTTWVIIAGGIAGLLLGNLP